MVRPHATRASILRRELERKHKLIIKRYLNSEVISEPLKPDHFLPWYLEISKEWVRHHLLRAESNAPRGSS